MKKAFRREASTACWL